MSFQGAVQATKEAVVSFGGSAWDKTSTGVQWGTRQVTVLAKDGLALSKEYGAKTFTYGKDLFAKLCGILATVGQTIWHYMQVASTAIFNSMLAAKEFVILHKAVIIPGAIGTGIGIGLGIAATALIYAIASSKESKEHAETPAKA
jgi:hypothetical protein